MIVMKSASIFKEICCFSVYHKHDNDIKTAGKEIYKMSKRVKIQFFDSGYHRSRLLRLVLPIAFQQLMLSCVSASDAIMLGRLDQNMMAAVSLAGQVSFVHSLFLSALTIGCSMFAAQYFGIQDFPAIERVFAFTMKFSGILSAAFSAAAALAPEFIMGILTNEPVLISYGAVYLRSVSLSFLLVGISQIYLCVMKNTGHVLISSLISSAAVIGNILLNALLIFGLFGLPKLEIRGAAYATVLSRIIECSWAVIFASSGHMPQLKPRLLFGRDKAFGKAFWKYTLPLMGNEIAWGCGFSMYSVILGHMGEDAVAANSLANIIKNLIICFSSGLSAGGGILIGNLLGAGKMEKAKLEGKRLLKLSILSGIISGLFLLLISPAVLHFSALTAGASEDLRRMLMISSYYIIGKSINSMTVGGIFPAGGDSRFGFLCDSVTLWCITVPLGAAAAFLFHAPVLTVYFLLNLDEIIKLPVVFRRFYKYLWVRNLTGQDTRKIA